MICLTLLITYSSINSAAVMMSSSLTTGMISSISLMDCSNSRDHMMIGLPARTKKGLFLSAPNRLPMPAAGTRATTLLSALLIFPDFREDHPSRGRLQNARYGQVDRFADQFPCIFDHHHGSVIQVCHALVVLLSFLGDVEIEGLARQHNRLEYVGKLVNIQDRDALHLRHLAQIEIIGHNLSAVESGKGDEFCIDLFYLGEVLVDDLNLDIIHLLYAVKDIETPPSLCPAKRIGGIGDILEFLQDKLRQYKHAFDEADLDYIGYPAVDDDASVEYLQVFFRLLSLEQAHDGRDGHVLAPVQPDDQSTVSENCAQDEKGRYSALIGNNISQWKKEKMGR